MKHRKWIAYGLDNGAVAISRLPLLSGWSGQLLTSDLSEMEITVPNEMDDREVEFELRRVGILFRGLRDF